MEKWMWGIDVSTKQLHFAALRDEEVEFTTTDPVSGSGREYPRRMEDLRREAQRATTGLAIRCPPLAVCVELPLGRFPSPALTGAWSVVLAAVWSTLSTLYDHEVLVTWATPSMWRAWAQLGAKADKEDVAAAALRAGAPEGLEQDFYDACVIADGARSQLTVGSQPPPA